MKLVGRVCSYKHEEYKSGPARGFWEFKRPMILFLLCEGCGEVKRSKNFMLFSVLRWESGVRTALERFNEKLVTTQQDFVGCHKHLAWRWWGNWVFIFVLFVQKKILCFFYSSFTYCKDWTMHQHLRIELKSRAEWISQRLHNVLYSIMLWN